MAITFSDSISDLVTEYQFCGIKGSNWWFFANFWKNCLPTTKAWRDENLPVKNLVNSSKKMRWRTNFRIELALFKDDIVINIHDCSHQRGLVRVQQAAASLPRIRDGKSNRGLVPFLPSDSPRWQDTNFRQLMDQICVWQQSYSKIFVGFPWSPKNSLNMS